MTNGPQDVQDTTAIETQEWIDSLEWVIQHGGHERVAQLLDALESYARHKGVPLPFAAHTPYINTIPPSSSRRSRATARSSGASRASSAGTRWRWSCGRTRTPTASAGTSRPTPRRRRCTKSASTTSSAARARRRAATWSTSRGTPRRASTRGRSSKAGSTESSSRTSAANCAEGGGLSSYPHPWLMPDFWQFPTVSMGLGPIMAIYQARFNRYLEDRGLKKTTEQQGVGVPRRRRDATSRRRSARSRWPSREKLDNLIFVINCNLQRLDGPVRGNGKIIQELEGAFRGAGWNVIKVIWGGDWDPLLARDKTGLLVQRMGEVVDGEYQKYSRSSDGEYIREHFFGKYPELLELVEAPVRRAAEEAAARRPRSGEGLRGLQGGRRDTRAQPTVILAKTIKGYGLGEAGEGRNITHQQKKLNEEELARVPHAVRHSDLATTTSRRRRSTGRRTTARRCSTCASAARQLGGYVPQRRDDAAPIRSRRRSTSRSRSSSAAADGREVSTTMAFVRLLAKLLRDKEIGKLVVPIVPDEARTFGMEALFRQVGIYAHVGQLYEPVDSRHAALLPGSEGRADPRRRHHRGRLDVVVHRRRHGLRDARRQHDSVLHLLLDVRLPADRRPDLGGRRHARAAASCWAAPPAARR